MSAGLLLQLLLPLLKAASGYLHDEPLLCIQPPAGQPVGPM